MAPSFGVMPATATLILYSAHNQKYCEQSLGHYGMFGTKTSTGILAYRRLKINYIKTESGSLKKN